MQREVARAFGLASKFSEDYTFLEKGQFQDQLVRQNQRSK